MPSSGKLQVSLETSAISSRSATTGNLDGGDYVLLKVTRSGTGISKRIMDRIFDPFFTTKGVGAGTGLGLSLAHGIVSDLGGVVDVQSEEGVGSSFTIFLPRAGEASPAQANAATVAPRGRGQHVLLVDDEVALVHLATVNLEAFGYKVTSYTSSALALKAFAANPSDFDAVVTDQRMPEK